MYWIAETVVESCRADHADGTVTCGREFAAAAIRYQQIRRAQTPQPLKTDNFLIIKRY